MIPKRSRRERVQRKRRSQRSVSPPTDNAHREGVTAVARRKGFVHKDVQTALANFILTSDDLTEKAWSGEPMSSGRVAALLGAKHFSYAVCDYAAQHAPDDKVYTWSICPAGRRHRRQFYFQGTRISWLTGECPTCQESAASREEWAADAPTFQDRYPDAVQYLSDPADAESLTGLVRFACTQCGDAMSWSPRSESPPCCSWCRAADGAQPGELVIRTGGGEPVKFEAELTVELIRCGFTASGDHGIVTKRGTYVVPVIKPDIVLPERRVAIEVDNTASNGWVHNRHDDPAGAADDQLRDQLLKDLEWRVLRVRRPGQPVAGDWPWRVETTSEAVRRVADLIVGLLGGPGV